MRAALLELVLALRLIISDQLLAMSGSNSRYDVYVRNTIKRKLTPKQLQGRDIEIQRHMLYPITGCFKQHIFTHYCLSFQYHENLLN